MRLDNNTAVPAKVRRREQKTNERPDENNRARRGNSGGERNLSCKTNEEKGERLGEGTVAASFL